MSVPERTSFAKHLQRDILSTSSAFILLHEYFLHDIEALPELIQSLQSNRLCELYSHARCFPTTEFGWSILPPDREEYKSDERSKQELADLTTIQFAKDRDYVEFLRKLLRDRINELGL